MNVARDLAEHELLGGAEGVELFYVSQRYHASNPISEVMRNLSGTSTICHTLPVAAFERLLTEKLVLELPQQSNRALVANPTPGAIAQISQFGSVLPLSFQSYDHQSPDAKT